MQEGRTFDPDRFTLLRSRAGHDAGKVGMIELFFDLVFVFAVTQLSHTLLEHLHPVGAAQALLLILAVWWNWIYTTWVTNWLDPERIPVRIGLFAMMTIGLLMSVSIPKAFGAHGALFACAYVAMHLSRTLFVLWAMRGQDVAMKRNFQRILAWLAASAAFWLVGGFGDEHDRMAWWSFAIALEMLGPSMRFGVPGLGRSSISDWNVDGHHIAERCALFVIIALGESLLVTGATMSRQSFDTVTIAAFAVAVLGTIAMWWIYFDTGAERAAKRIGDAHDPGRHARVAYTYAHVLIVAGIIVGAVGDEIVLAHPEHADDAGMLAILCGPLCFLLGTAWFKWVMNDRRLPPLSHLVGLALIGLLAFPALTHRMSAIAAAACAVVALIVVAAWERIALTRRPRRVGG